MIVVSLKVHGSTETFAILCTSRVLSSSKLTLPEPGEGFGLHLTAIPGHETTGVLSIEEVEEIFTFDLFMDWNWCGVLPSQRQVANFRENHKTPETRFLDEVVETHADDHSTATSLRHIIIYLGRCRPTLFQVLAMVSRRALGSESSREK